MKTRNTLVIYTVLLTLLTEVSIAQQFSQNTYNRTTISLDGLWDAIVDPLENGYLSGSLAPRKKGYYTNETMQEPYSMVPYNFEVSKQLYVPGDWNTQMEKLYYYEGTVWYELDFDYKKKEKTKTILRFDAVNYQCKVFLNGEHIGDHVGGFRPFEFDITDKIKEENFIVLKVDNSRRREAVPTVNFDWWNYGGITRSAHLIEVPETHIADYLFRLSNDEKSIIGYVQLAGEEDSGKEINIRIPELKKELKITTDESGKANFSIKAQPKRWSFESPKLYDIEISSDQDEVADEIGFKTISTSPTQIILNGEPVFLKGISIHEQAPYGAGRVTSVEQCRILLQWAKELGCNFVRLAHYPHNEAMVREAEKMGFLVWSEIPVYWAIDYNNPDTYQNAEQQLTDMIHRDKNRVAIGMWSVANETPILDERLVFLKSIIKKARELDPTRLISAALHKVSSEGNTITIEDPLGEYIDVIGINSYCGWYNNRDNNDFCRDMVWKNQYAKPMIMSEMGGGALYGLHGEKNEIWSEEYQANVYDCNIDMIKNIDFLTGMSP